MIGISIHGEQTAFTGSWLALKNVAPDNVLHTWLYFNDEKR